MGKINFLILLLPFVLLSPHENTATPNLSGIWKLNMSKSQFRGLPIPRNLILEITHSGNIIDILSKRNQRIEKVRYVVDGNRFFLSGASEIAEAHWENGMLLVAGHDASPIPKWKWAKSYRISDDGRSLTINAISYGYEGQLDTRELLILERQ